MTTDSNKPGPTTLWKTIKGKDVKTNDGKELGEIKDISDNYIRVEKGKIHKESFWIPKYIADAFDGKTLWLLMDEEELRGKYQYGKAPPQGDQYTKDFQSFKGTPYGQNRNYAADFYENIRVVENYKNIRDLHMAQSEHHSHGEEHTHVHKEVERSKQNERKEKEKIFNTERVEVPEYTSIPIKLASPETIQRPVQPITIESKFAESKIGEIKKSDTSSSSPVRLQSTQMSSGTTKKARQQDRSRAPLNSYTAGQSPVRITPVSTQSPITSTTIAAASNISSVSSSGFPPVRSGEKEIVPKSPIDSVEVEHSTLPIRKEDAIMVAASICITPEKEMNIKPVLTEPMPMLKATKNKEDQNIMVSESNNKSNLLALKTSQLPTLFSEELKPISSNLIHTNSNQDSQLALQGDRIQTIENVKPMMDYFKPFLGGIDIWQPWMDMYNEFVIVWIRLSVNYFEQFWKLFGRSTAAD
jgi:hypothetical protein